MGAIPVTEAGRGILYDAPSTSKHVVQLKRASYAKGEYPEHLKPFAGQIAHCPRECKGRKGRSYAECLTECAKPARRGS